MGTVIIDTETYRAAVDIEGGFKNLSQFGLSLLVVGVPADGEAIGLFGLFALRSTAPFRAIRFCRSAAGPGFIGSGR